MPTRCCPHGPTAAGDCRSHPSAPRVAKASSPGRRIQEGEFSLGIQSVPPCTAPGMGVLGCSQQFRGGGTAGAGQSPGVTMGDFGVAFFIFLLVVIGRSSGVNHKTQWEAFQGLVFLKAVL